MSMWKFQDLKNLSERITKGTTPTTLGFSFVSDGINFIKAESISRSGEINPNTFSKIDQKTHFALRRSILDENDVLITIAGIYLGKIGFVKKKHIPANTNQAVAIVRTKKDVLSPLYLKYYLLVPSTTVFLNSLCPQSAQPNLNLTQLGKLKIPLPPLPIQRKIAAILSAYDELIENNNRRIAMLEKMAEEIYREWFVRLRFPGHEKVKVVKGVPEGWEVKKIKDAIDYCGGGTPSTSISSYWQNGNINWYSPTDLTSSNAMFSFKSNQLITDLGLKESSARLFPKYSLMMTSRATIGKISINTTPACTNQGFITCIPNSKLPLYYLYFWLESHKEYLIQISNGATFLELTKGRFREVDIVVPSGPIMLKYIEIQKPLFAEIEQLLKSLDIVKTTRDRLLPRLISGKLDVENLDIAFPPGMKEEKEEAHA